MIQLLFGYSNGYEFHGPLETVFSFLDIFQIYKAKYTCKDFYIAAKQLLINEKRSIDIFKIFRNQRIDLDNEMFIVDVCSDKEFYAIKNYNEDMRKNILKLSIENMFEKAVECIIKDKEFDPSFDNNDAINKAFTIYVVKRNVIFIRIMKIIWKDERVKEKKNHLYDGVMDLIYPYRSVSLILDKCTIS